MNRDLCAFVWARNLGGNTIMKYLEKGDRFKWPHGETVFVNCGRGWYHREGESKKFRSGMRTGVVKL